MQEVRTKIRELREAKGLTQGQLARKLNIDRSYVNKIENGSRLPGRDLTFLIAEVFGISPEKLFVN